MASYRESLVTPERGRQFMSPLCGEPMPTQFSESMLTDRSATVLPENNAKQSAMTNPLPNPTNEWFKFPSYSHMLAHRIYEAGSPIVENEAGYPDELLTFRKEKAAEYKMACAIQTGDFNESFENKAQKAVLEN